MLILVAFSAAAQVYNDAERKYIATQKQLMNAHPGINSSCTSIPPWTVISQFHLKLRTSTYEKKMGRCQLPCADDITFQIDDAITLLQKLSADGYDGFRVYFGIDPSSRNNTPLGKDTKWNLIFVPTTCGGWYHRHKPDQNKRHVDDLKNCLFVREKGVEPITDKDASAWINKAYYYIDSVERYRQKKYHRFHETRNLWYNNNYVRDNCIGNGLLQTLICKKSLGTQHVYAKFAAFFFVPHWEQITLVFQVDDGDKKAFLTLSSTDRSPKALLDFPKCFPRKKGAAAAPADSGGSDTGHPCPPPKPSNGTTSGALLPNQ